VGFTESQQEGDMPITAAVQRGTSVWVYNEKGRAYLQLNGTLLGFTSTTITIQNRNSNTVRVLDEKGNGKFTTTVKK